jgi:hypothetical protein
MKPSGTANDMSIREESAGAFSPQFAPADWPADATRHLPSYLTARHWLRILAVAFSLFTSTTVGQDSKEVPVAREPGHHRVFENSFVRVFRVTIPANQQSLLHRHDLDYAYVSLGPADVINAIVGKPEARVNLEDGHIGFAKGGFAHVATAVGMPFNNVTIELLKPQGEPRNLCDKVVPGDVGKCYKENRIGKFTILPSFETDEIKVSAYELQPAVKLGDVPEADVLLVAFDQARCKVHVTGQPDVSLAGGTTTWIKRNSSLTLENTSDHPSRLMWIKFKDATAPSH